MLCDACKDKPEGVSGGGVISEGSQRPEVHPLSQEALLGDLETTRAHYVSHHWDPSVEDLHIPTHGWHGEAHATGNPSHTHKETV